ncbi:MAG: hypothetical protein JW809_12865 [Pirellulales bacterium]|nr:hypothetical protein [Pirellulales bacterium]
MDTTLNNWRDVFCRWPAELPRRGIVITSFGEQIPFAGFLTCEGFVLLARAAPDSMGGRMVVLPYQSIEGMKFTDVLKTKALHSMGFEGELPKT